MIYTKTDASGKQIFSDCRVIQLDGTWISNPSAEQIAAAGWVEYIPPVIPPQPATEPSYDAMIQAVKTMLAEDVAQLSDEDALAVAALYPAWIEQEGKAVAVGERYWYDERLWKVIQAHTVQSDWTPDTAVSLYVEVSVAEWPEWRQPTGAHDAYNTGDKVTYEGHHYICTIDGNIWCPVDYPIGWDLVE